MIILPERCNGELYEGLDGADESVDSESLAAEEAIRSTVQIRHTIRPMFKIVSSSSEERECLRAAYR